MPFAVIGRTSRLSCSPRSAIMRLSAILSVAGTIMVVAAMLGHRTIWNLSASVPRGLYAIAVDGTCARGSLVAFGPPPGAAAIIYRRGYLPPGAGLIKKLVGLPGDRVCVRDDGVYVNGTRIGDVARFDSRGKALDPFPFCGEVGPGQAFVASQAPLSYDSRYFGPVRLASLTPVVPVWTY